MFALEPRRPPVGDARDPRRWSFWFDGYLTLIDAVADEAYAEGRRAGAEAAARAREDLERYGEHDIDCAACVLNAAGDAPCTCGYDGAIRARSKETPDGA